MDKEVLFLRYLDGELEGEELEMVKSLLEESYESRLLLERIRSTKEETLELIYQLNPKEDVTIPEWREPQVTTVLPKRNIENFWRWAAIIILPLAIFFILRETGGNRKRELQDSAALRNPEQESILPGQTNIDYAISPNRCWTQKQLVGTGLILNSF